MFRAPLCPSSGEQDCVLPYIVLFAGSANVELELGKEILGFCDRAA